MPATGSGARCAESTEQRTMSPSSSSTRVARVITWVLVGVSLVTTLIVRLLKRPPAEAEERVPRSEPEGLVAQAEPEEMVEEPESTGRRRFLARLSLALGGYAAAVMGVPVAGFVLSPLLRQEPEVWRPVGEVSRFPAGETILVDILNASPVPWAGQTARSAVWLRHEGGGAFTAFSVHCTHLGCPVRWQPGAQLFLCPCHGGAFYRNGLVASGPPPVPLATLATRVRDGQVEIRTGQIPLP